MKVKVHSGPGRAASAAAQTPSKLLAAPALAFLLSLAGAAPGLATVYELPKDAPPIVGEDQTYTTVYEDTLYDLARKYSLGSEELIRVNPGVDPWLPGAGTKITIPGRHILPPVSREGIVVNLPEHRPTITPNRAATARAR